METFNNDCKSITDLIYCLHDIIIVPTVEEK